MESLKSIQSLVTHEFLQFCCFVILLSSAEVLLLHCLIIVFGQSLHIIYSLFVAFVLGSTKISLLIPFDVIKTNMFGIGHLVAFQINVKCLSITSYCKIFFGTEITITEFYIFVVTKSENEMNFFKKSKSQIIFSQKA